MSALLGNTVRAAREAAGWTQEHLAVAAGISRKYLSQIELGKVDPSLSTTEKLASALRFTLTIPLGGKVLAGSGVAATEVVEKLRQMREEIDSIVSRLSRPTDDAETSARHQINTLLDEVQQEAPERRDRVMESLRYIVPRLLKGGEVLISEASALPSSTARTERGGGAAVISLDPAGDLESQQSPVTSAKRRRRR